MAKSPKQVAIRTYQVGFGDCFLLSFKYDGNVEKHVLVDFGTTKLPPQAPATRMLEIARDIEKRTGGMGRGFRFHYGVRVCPEPVHWGGLSGCTYSEGVSWGKFVPYEEGGRFAEVLSDATLVWPLLVQGLLESLGK